MSWCPALLAALWQRAEKIMLKDLVSDVHTTSAVILRQRCFKAGDILNVFSGLWKNSSKAGLVISVFLWSYSFLIMKPIISGIALHWQLLELLFCHEGAGQPLQEVSPTALGVCRSSVPLKCWMWGRNWAGLLFYWNLTCKWKIMICIKIPQLQEHCDLWKGRKKY